MDMFENYKDATKQTDSIINEYIPIPSMYGIFAYMWLIFMGNVGNYTTMHGCNGII